MKDVINKEKLIAELDETIANLIANREQLVSNEN
jgi:hypothetical protein